MKVRVLFLLFAMSGIAGVSFAQSHTLSEISGPPDGLSDNVRDALQDKGVRISGPDAICELWLVKSAVLKPGFKATLNVKYPFTSGELIGALHVVEDAAFHDFRGQKIKPGAYTLRYGQQPMDGNHIGTSDLADFLLALPAGADTDPKTIAAVGSLTRKSAGTAGATHPAIFALLPVDTPVAETSLSHDDSRDFWILSAAGTGEQDGKSVPVGLRLVVIGRALE